MVVHSCCASRSVCVARIRCFLCHEKPFSQQTSSIIHEGHDLPRRTLTKPSQSQPIVSEHQHPAFCGIPASWTVCSTRIGVSTTSFNRSKSHSKHGHRDKEWRWTGCLQPRGRSTPEPHRSCWSCGYCNISRKGRRFTYVCSKVSERYNFEESYIITVTEDRDPHAERTLSRPASSGILRRSRSRKDQPSDCCMLESSA